MKSYILIVMPKIPYVAPQPVTKQEVLVGNTERSTQIGLT